MDKGSYYDRHVNIISWSNKYKVIVGKYCSIGRDCNFFLHANHRPDWITTSSQLWGPVTPEIADMHMDMGHPTCNGDIIIGNDVWIGAHATIMSGVHIASGAVVAAGALVTKDVSPYTIVGGNPAVEIRKRFDDRIVEALLEIEWWNWPENKIKQEAMLLWSDRVDIFVRKHENKYKRQ